MSIKNLSFLTSDVVFSSQLQIGFFKLDISRKNIFFLFLKIGISINDLEEPKRIAMAVLDPISDQIEDIDLIVIAPLDHLIDQEAVVVIEVITQLIFELVIIVIFEIVVIAIFEITLEIVVIVIFEIKFEIEKIIAEIVIAEDTGATICTAVVADDHFHPIVINNGEEITEEVEVLDIILMTAILELLIWKIFAIMEDLEVPIVVILFG